MRVITDLHELVKDPNGFTSQFGKGGLFSLCDDCMSVPVFSLKMYVLIVQCSDTWFLSRSRQTSLYCFRMLRLYSPNNFPHNYRISFDMCFVLWNP